jgi:hypothetical protein
MVSYKWLFVGEIPLLYEKRRVAKQLKIEVWLDLAWILQNLGLKQLKKKKCSSRGLSYLV